MLNPAFINYEPRPLKFGTSGLRANVEDMTDLEVYINTKGCLLYLSCAGEIKKGDTVVVGGDLRPSTERLMKAVVRAIEDSGLKARNLGPLPTPALTYYAMQKKQASVMVTGSHIPFHMNGIKYNKAAGEVLKSDEAGILAAVSQVRSEEYARDASGTIFDCCGALKRGEQRDLPPASAEGTEMYVRRYSDVFPPDVLKGVRVLYYQHSAVGRDLVPCIIEKLGCSVDRAGRSEKFIAIDTEDITDVQLKTLQNMADEEEKKNGVKYDALVSTDGDSDRPLVCGITDGKVRFFGGDLLGAVVAEFLGADVAAVPVSANSAVDVHLKNIGIETVKTRIGSPYVIQAMKDAEKIFPGKIIVSWEANGGFLTGTDITLCGKVLKALPTRDPLLPILSALVSARGKGISLAELFNRLPKRFGKAGLIDNFPREASGEILKRFSAAGPAGKEAVFTELGKFFSRERGFGDITDINTVDGIRIFFSNGDIAHIRPSGNAPQLRIYSNADTQERANEIVNMGISEPGGILRELEKFVK